MSPRRALGVIRLSKSADPASTSIERQREIIEAYAATQGMTLVGFAEDMATSAFHIPPERRKAIGQWLERPGEFDCLLYWRQDRLVRRAADFMGLVTWCQANSKALYSATEGTGDVTQHAGMLLGFLQAWQSEGESRSTSARTKSSQAKLAEQGRWRGGRVPYGFRASARTGGPGFELVPDESGTAAVCREAVRRVIGGESVNAVTADFNRRAVLSADGGLWAATTLRKILRNRALLDGIVGPAEYGDLQAALGARKVNRQVRTLGRESLLLDLIFCECGGKIYRWHKVENGRFFGRCRNEMKRSEARIYCRLPMMPYDALEALVSASVLGHADDLIETLVTDGARRLRIDDISRELIGLSADFAAKRVDRAEYLARQSALLDEQESLEGADSEPEWRKTGETVGHRWDRLSAAERRLWLLRIGVTFVAQWEAREDGARRIRVTSSWHPPGGRHRERIVRP